MSDVYSITTSNLPSLRLLYVMELIGLTAYEGIEIVTMELISAMRAQFTM